MASINSDSTANIDALTGVERAVAILWRLSTTPEMLFEVCYRLPKSHVPEVVMSDNHFRRQWLKYHQREIVNKLGRRQTYIDDQLVKIVEPVGVSSLVKKTLVGQELLLTFTDASTTNIISDGPNSDGPNSDGPNSDVNTDTIDLLDTRPRLVAIESYRQNSNSSDGNHNYRLTCRGFVIEAPHGRYHVFDELKYIEHGTRCRYHNNGQLQSISSYNLGTLEGDCKIFTDTGQQTFTANYKNGQLDGYYRSLGLPIVDSLSHRWNREASYKDGKVVGEFKQWNINGRLTTRSLYSDCGVLIHSKYISSDTDDNVLVYETINGKTLSSLVGQISTDGHLTGIRTRLDATNSNFIVDQGINKSMHRITDEVDLAGNIVEEVIHSDSNPFISNYDHDKLDYIFESFDMRLF